MSKGQSDNTNNATKMFDYTAVAGRLRTVSWSNHGHPTGVFNQWFTGPTFPLPATAILINDEWWMINDDSLLRKSQEISIMIYLLILFLQFILYLYIIFFIPLFLLFLYLFI